MMRWLPLLVALGFIVWALAVIGALYLVGAFR